MDTPTSGIVIAARNKETYQYLVSLQNIDKIEKMFRNVWNKRTSGGIDMNELNEKLELENGSELVNGDYTAAREVCEKFSAEEDKDNAEATAARLFAMLVA